MAKARIVFEDGGKAAFAVIPWREYERLAGRNAEAGLSDEELAALAESENEESFPIETADRLLAGENPVRVFRDLRGMTQKRLAEAAGIGPARLSRIERGRSAAPAPTLAALARALEVDADDLIPSERTRD